MTVSEVLSVIGRGINRFAGGYSWLPLISLAALIILVGLGFQRDWLPREVKGDTYGFRTELLIIAASAGFLGSFVNVLNRAYGGY